VEGRVSLATVAVLLVIAAPATGAPGALDPPRVVPWHLIGNIGLGMSKARVERLYGQGTVASPPKDALVWQYRGRGVIDVTYDLSGNVASVETTSSDYASRSGIHVGIPLPPRLCDFVNYRCKHSWHGFTYEPDYKTWERVSKLGRFARSYVEIAIDSHAVVDRISLTRYLDCSSGEYAIRDACRKPPPGEDFRFYFPPPAGLRYCQLPGGPGNFLAASPAVPCRDATVVQSGLTSCLTETRCTVVKFRCVAEWAGGYDRSFQYTHHAICVAGPSRRVVWDGG
jgi:hypothetical protein